MGPLGACGLINGKGYNLGYVQSSPQMLEDGSISIVYQNGDRCDSTSFYSTRIIFQCDDHPVSTTARRGTLAFILSIVMRHWERTTVPVQLLVGLSEPQKPVAHVLRPSAGLPRVRPQRRLRVRLHVEDV